MKNQRQILIDCLKYCRHRSKEHPFAGIHKTGVKLQDIEKTIDEILKKSSETRWKLYIERLKRCQKIEEMLWP